MLEFLSTKLARAVMLFSAMATLVAFGAYLVSKWRESNEDNKLTPNELITKFRKLHSKGVVDDEEFRTIKAKLAVEFRKQLNDSDEPGYDE